MTYWAIYRGKTMVLSSIGRTRKGTIQNFRFDDRFALPYPTWDVLEKNGYSVAKVKVERVR